MRAAQRARGEKPRYDGRWRDSKDRAAARRRAGDPLQEPARGRGDFPRPREGPITISNGELDDLVLLREDGVPTYNFGVVVDDLDMNITPRDPRRRPRQQHAAADQHLRAPWATELPQFAPRADDPRRRRRAPRPSATARSASCSTASEGYLPEALVNYLARLGWSHGDEEIFSQRAARRVVRPRARQPLAGAVQPGEAAVAEPPAPEEALRYRVRRNLIGPASRKEGADPSDGPDPERWRRLLKERSRDGRRGLAEAR